MVLPCIIACLPIVLSFLGPVHQVDQRVQRLDRDRNNDELARLLKKHEEAAWLKHLWWNGKGASLNVTMYTSEITWKGIKWDYIGPIAPPMAEKLLESQSDLAKPSTPRSSLAQCLGPTIFGSGSVQTRGQWGGGARHRLSAAAQLEAVFAWLEDYVGKSMDKIVFILPDVGIGCYGLSFGCFVGVGAGNGWLFQYQYLMPDDQVPTDRTQSAFRIEEIWKMKYQRHSSSDQVDSSRLVDSSTRVFAVGMWVDPARFHAYSTAKVVSDAFWLSTSLWTATLGDRVPIADFGMYTLHPVDQMPCFFLKCKRNKPTKKVMFDTDCLDEMYTSLAFSLPKSSCLAGCTKSRTGWSGAEWVRFCSQTLRRHVEKASSSGCINGIFRDHCIGTFVLFTLSVCITAFSWIWLGSTAFEEHSLWPTSNSPAYKQQHSP